MSFQKIDVENTERPDGKASVLVYGYQDTEHEAIEALLAQFSEVEAIYIEKDMLGLTLEQIIEGTPERIEFKLPMNPKVVVMNSLSEDEIHRMIEGFKKLSTSKPIFAMVTETSRKWKFGNLVKELIEEHMMMSKHHKK